MKFNGKKIEIERIRVGLTRVELAKILGTTRVTIWRWEMGVVVPSVNDLPKIAKACRVDVGYFFR